MKAKNHLNNFEDLGREILAHISNFKNHKDYLGDLITRCSTGGLTQKLVEEICDYSSDIFGPQKKTDSKFASNFVNKYVAILKFRLSTRIDQLKVIYSFLIREDESNLVNLYYHSKFLQAINKEDKRIVNDAEEFLIKAEFAFNSSHILTSIVAYAEQRVDTKELDSLYSVDVKVVTKGNERSTITRNRFNLADTAEKLKKILSSQVELIDKYKRLNKTEHLNDLPYKESELQEIGLLLAQGQLIKKKAEERDSDEAIFLGITELTDYYFLSKKAIQKFSDISRKINAPSVYEVAINETVRPLQTRFQNAKKPYINASARYLKCSDKVQADNQDLLKEIDELINSIDSSLKKIPLNTKQLHSWGQSIGNAISSLNRAMNKFLLSIKDQPSDSMANSTSPVETNWAKDSFQPKVELQQETPKNEELKADTESQENKEATKDSLPPLPPVNAMASTEERNRLLEMNNANTIKYKEKLAKERLKRENEKKLKARIQPKEQPNKIIYQNLTMAERLAEINTSETDLLDAIFHTKKNVSYNQVYYFIINRLQGEVNEIGNGSSHKQIKIDKLLVEMTSANNIEAELAKKQVEVESLQKPHARMHGKLSVLNVSILKDFFIRAGITTEFVAKLVEEKKKKEQNDKTAKNDKTKGISFFSSSTASSINIVDIVSTNPKK